MFYNMKTQNSYVHYMTISSELDHLGMICTTVGHQTILPHHLYPPIDTHPVGYYFRKDYGRRLPEYQIVFLTEGQGYFQSEHISRRLITRGTAILLFPNEWHFYEPNPETGWTEYWVGFRGKGSESFVREMMLSPENPLVKIKDEVRFLSLYKELIATAEHELSGYQILCSGLTTHMLSICSYAQHSNENINQNISSAILKAQDLMRQYVGHNISPEQIAKEIGVGYSWFRQTFKTYVGTSPAQYQQLLRVQRAEFLLSNPTLSVADIAYELGFANPNQFSTFFRQHKHVSPLGFRKQIGVRGSSE